MKWHDKRANTVDFAEIAETGKTDKQRGTAATKLKVILDYNLGTQSIDVSDQMSYYAATRDDHLQDRETSCTSKLCEISRCLRNKIVEVISLVFTRKLVYRLMFIGIRSRKSISYLSKSFFYLFSRSQNESTCKIIKRLSQILRAVIKDIEIIIDKKKT